MKLKKSILIGGLLFFELCLPLAVIWRLNMRAANLYGLMELVSVIVVILLINSRDNPSYKVGWTFVILVFPLFGVFIYLLAGTHYLSPRLRKMLRMSKRLSLRQRRQDKAVKDALRGQGGIRMRQSGFITRLSGMPVYRGTRVQLLFPGEKMFEALKNELRSAGKFIFIEYFIISKGRMWDTIFSILKEKAESGVEVRIIYDDAGSMDLLPRRFKEACAAAGIKTAAFNPFVPVLKKILDYRDHRKIVVIDGNVGFTGGTNIADEYINEKRLHGYWYDGGVMLSGDAVWNFTAMFIDMWILITGERLFYRRYRVTESEPDDGFVQPFGDSPFSDNTAEGAYMQLINTASGYVYIMTPYLIIDHEMSVALCNAALGGVDVRIITPNIGDKWFVHTVTRSFYQQLLDCGVKIYEYTPGFIHAKMILCDGGAGITGSVNMDYRSFYLQFEDAVWICGGGAIVQMKREFDRILDVSRQIDATQWRKRGFPVKTAEVLLRLFSPLM